MKRLEKILDLLIYIPLIALINIIFFILIKGLLTTGSSSCIILGILIIFIALFIDCLLLSKMVKPSSAPTTTTPFTGNDALGCVSGKIIADEITRGIHK